MALSEESTKASVFSFSPRSSTTTARHSVSTSEGLELRRLVFMLGVNSIVGERGKAQIRLLICDFQLSIVIRARVVEELFYRGFAIERLQAVGLPRPAAAILIYLLMPGMRKV